MTERPGGAVPVAADEGQWLDVHDASAAGTVRRAAAGLAASAGLTGNDTANLAIVATELATNLGRHAVEGRVLVRLRRGRDAVGVELVAVDRGPGMADVHAFAEDGRSTAGSLGIGLGAIARKSSAFDIYSVVGQGTVLAVTVGLASLPTEAGLTRPIAGEQVCGDGYGGRTIEGRRQLLLCDGLGHGPLAAIAARAVLAAFATAPADGPAGVLEHVHQHARNTRGAVAGVAELDWRAGRLRYAGIGNIAAVVVDGPDRRALVSLPGIVGQQRRDIREFEYDLPGSAVVVLHSDGLTDRWDLGSYPGLAARSATVIAATLLRDAGRRRDDAGILVVKRP